MKSFCVLRMMLTAKYLTINVNWHNINKRNSPW